ncbi:serine/threonine protein kinase [Dictyobacter aurantiacus]|uniref:Protein kinase domain-containing protein n=1 Tax=Dictyobacter aurantiacus TaxID=1936993 RepID=A0A401ZE78_9CHLR|nr:serine/threonine-protein kinase [Dictyobacter aurantiacus]GCE05181.1 hypothetical protein KDAU_25100 [Dictyobacter aurantiacus]
MSMPDDSLAKQSSDGFVFGNYRLFRVLRRGTNSTIYLGEHIHLGNKVVVKVLNNWVANDEQITKFCAEARLHASLRHPNIVRILDFGIKGRSPFMVMDYAANGTLQDYFEPDVAQPLTAIIPFVCSIASALQYVHNHNIIHRDIKPQNILLSRGHEVWLSDFGIAIAVQPGNLHSLQESIGTALYAAPEQIEGYPLKMSDQYALAVLVYTWLCGRPPFAGSSLQLCKQHLYREPLPPHEIVPTISRQLEKVILKALAKDPYQRFNYIQDFAYALRMADDSYFDAPLRMFSALQPAREVRQPS